MVELPQGVVVEVRRGGHDALAKLSADMVRLGISGYIRIERRPKELMPRVSQVVIHDTQPKVAIHEADAVLGGLEALLEIERDSTALDALISLIELPDDDVIRIVNLYPDFTLATEEQQEEHGSSDWWNYVQLTSRSWRREARLPEQEVVVEAPEYIRQLTKAKLQKFDLGEQYLNYGDTLLSDSAGPNLTFTLAGLLALQGRPLLVLSRSEAVKLAENYGIPESSCWRFSGVVQGNHIAPNAAEISEKITHFLWANKQAVVMFSDLEYLLSSINFGSLMQMFRGVIDNIRSADHLLLVHCNLEVMNLRERHIFQREFDHLSSAYLESLVMDPESLVDHPICMELTDEELTWIQQQISFLDLDDSEALSGDQVISGGASSLIDDDIEDAKEQLDQLIDEWQDVNKPYQEGNPIVNEISGEVGMVETLVDTAFSAVTAGDMKPLEKILDAKMSEPSVELSTTTATPERKAKGPRPAIKIKRAKRGRQNRVNSFHQTSHPKVTVDNRVELPELTEVTDIKTSSQVFDSKLDRRAELMDNALDNMLTGPERQQSRRIYQSVNQKPIASLEEFNTKTSSKTLAVSRVLEQNTEVIPASNIAANDGAKRRQREASSLTQSRVDLDKTYRKWATEYSGDNSSTNDRESIEYLEEAE